MNKKFYDKDGYLVGLLFGEATDIIKECDMNESSYISNAFIYKPYKDGYKTNIIEEGIKSYSYSYSEIPKDELPDELIKEFLQEEIMNSIIVDSKPAKKEGYILKPFLDGNHISWTFEEDENYSNLGSYLNPIIYIEGMEVKSYNWYTNGADIWEAIKDGIPNNFEDKEYFEII